MDTGSFEDLLQKLKSPAAPARYTAANLLGKLGDKAAVNHLLLALDDKDEKVADNVIFALGELGDPKAVSPIIKVLRHSKSDRLRKSAAKALGLIGSRDAVEALITALKDPDFKVRKSAARALGRIGDMKAVPALKEAMKDDDFNVVKYAEDALDRLGAL